MDRALLPGGGEERNQRVGGGSGQATALDAPEDCAELGQAPAAGRCCIGGGSGHWTCDCPCAGWAGGALAVGADSSFGLATTFGFGLGFALTSGLASAGSAGAACAVG